MTSGQAVKTFRSQLGLSLSQFAYAIGHWDGITPNCLNKTRAIRRWETGEVPPPHWVFLLVQASSDILELHRWIQQRGLSRPAIDPTEHGQP